MNPYSIGVFVSIIIFIAVGVVAGRKVKNTNDYYVAGRRAPTILIVGSLIASFLSTGAFLGMLLGFIGCVVPKTISALMKITLPIYLDSFFIGVILSIIGIIIGNKLKPATSEAIAEYDLLHVVPESEKSVLEIKKTHNLYRVYILFGIVVGLFFVFMYAVPFMNHEHR